MVLASTLRRKLRKRLFFSLPKGNSAVSMKSSCLRSSFNPYGRSGKGKATKNSNEAEYRTIFDNLISDLLAVLYWPEWPAASLLLSIACKYMVSCIQLPKQ